MKKYLLLLAFLPFAAFGQHSYLSDKLATASYIIQEINGIVYAVPAFGSGLNSYFGANFKTVIENAMGQLASGGSVFIKKGLYDNVDPLVIPFDNIKIQGEGKYLTKLKLKNAADAGSLNGNLINILGKDGFELSDVELDGNKANQTKLDDRNEIATAVSNGIYARDSVAWSATNNLYIHDCYIHSFAQQGLTWGGGGAGAQTSTDALISHCEFVDNGWCGFEFYSYTFGGKVENCFFNDNALGTLLGNYHTIIGCVIDDIYNVNSWTANDYGISLEGGVQTDWATQTGISLTNCKFIGDDWIVAIYSISAQIDLFINNIEIATCSTADANAIKIKSDTRTSISNITVYPMTGSGTIGIWMYASVDAVMQNINITHVDYGMTFTNNATRCRVLNCYVNSDHYSFNIASGSTDNIFMNNIINTTTLTTKIVDAGTGTILKNNYDEYAKVRWTETSTLNNTRTATADGLTTGLISTGSQNITVTSANAAYIICLPITSASTVGQVITGQIGANGCELRVIAAQAGTVYINNVTTNVEAAIPASSTFEVRCIDATHWVLKVWDATGTYSAPIPDAV